MHIHPKCMMMKYECWFIAFIWLNVCIIIKYSLISTIMLKSQIFFIIYMEDFVSIYQNMDLKQFSNLCIVDMVYKLYYIKHIYYSYKIQGHRPSLWMAARLFKGDNSNNLKLYFKLLLIWDVFVISRVCDIELFKGSTLDR